MVPLLLSLSTTLLSAAAGSSSGSSCGSALLAARCNDSRPADCDLCAAHNQRPLRLAGCSASAVLAWCSGWPVDITDLYIVDGRIQPGGQLVGTHASQLQTAIDGCFSPAISGPERNRHSVFNSSVLRHLHLQGQYFSDAPLSLPSLFVLELQGTLSAAANLSVDTPPYTAMVQLLNVSYSAVLGGTFDASSLPAAHDPATSKGYMALSIKGGAHNAIRHVRALSNNSESIIGINMSPHAEVANCDVGGGHGEMLQTRCIWTLATSQALLHDNHVHNCSFHALDLDAYTSSSVAWNNLCEGNGQEGIFLEESAHDCSLFNNTCQYNRGGIGVYSSDVGPVANNFIINNRLIRNRNYGLSAGGYGHDPDKMSLSNIFAANVVRGNAWDMTPTRWGPAPNAQVNPAHGAVSKDYWTNNVVQPSAGGLRWDMAHAPQNAAALTIFEPEI